MWAQVKKKKIVDGGLVFEAELKNLELPELQGRKCLGRNSGAFTHKA